MSHVCVAENCPTFTQNRSIRSGGFLLGKEMKGSEMRMDWREGGDSNAVLLKGSVLPGRKGEERNKIKVKEML